MKNKRAQAGVSKVILGLLVIFFIIVGIVAAINWGSNGPSAIPDAFDVVTDVIMSVAGPTFDFLLNLDQDENTNFLIVLVFILVSIVVIGTLDSINIFGENKQGNIINFVIGIIVSIIGIRFMPSDLWVSLTAPSSALVATILVGTPFVALTFVTMKIKFNLARKLLWLFFVIFMSYLVFFPGTEFFGNAFSWVYLIFLVLAAIMLFFDSSVRKFIYKEKAMSGVERGISDQAAQEMAILEAEIKKLMKDRKSASASNVRSNLQSQITRKQAQYRELAGRYFSG